VVAADE